MLPATSMDSELTGEECLNCGEPLSGPFCSKCGQRAIPAYPTLRELVGDAWQELSGYDGRVLRTFRHLMRWPGALTLEVLEGSGGEGIILSVGGGVSPGMPRENVVAMYEALQSFNASRG